MTPLATLATGAFKAMWDLYDRKYGKTAKQIDRLRRDAIEAQEKIGELRTAAIEMSAVNARLRHTIQEQASEVRHWTRVYGELVELFKAPASLDDNPYEGGEAP